MIISISAFISKGKYEYHQNSFCGGSTIGQYSSVQDANNACESDTRCRCISDVGCNGNMVLIFDEGSVSPTSEEFHSCSMIKGNFILYVT